MILIFKSAYLISSPEFLMIWESTEMLALETEKLYKYIEIKEKVSDKCNWMLQTITSDWYFQIHEYTVELICETFRDL